MACGKWSVVVRRVELIENVFNVPETMITVLEE